MKQNPLLVLALSVLTASASSVARDRSVVVVGQPVAGRRAGGATTAVLGLPLPGTPRGRHAPADHRSDEVPEILGSVVRWHAYTLDGRSVGSGRIEFTEAGGRRLLLTGSEVGGRGPRVIVCQGLQGGSLWRRLLWITGP